MREFETNDFFHGSLKSLNILINDKLEIALCDFGLQESNTSIMKWMAPEIFSSKIQTNLIKCDVYSFAIICWELASRSIPWNDETNLQLVTNVLNGKRPTIPEDTPSSFVALIKRCWSQNSAARPSFSQIVDR